MNADPIDELGPVDYLVIEFPKGAKHFSGEMAAELTALADTELIRVLDLLILDKDDNGEIEAFELDDLDDFDELRALETQMAEILAAEDVEHLAAAMEPGSTGAVLIWENTWAAPFASAVRRSGGQLVASGRIPIQAIVASLEADQSAGSEGDWSCPYDQDEAPAVASSEHPLPALRLSSALRPSCTMASTDDRTGVTTGVTTGVADSTAVLEAATGHGHIECGVHIDPASLGQHVQLACPPYSIPAWKRRACGTRPARGSSPCFGRRTADRRSPAMTRASGEAPSHGAPRQSATDREAERRRAGSTQCRDERADGGRAWREAPAPVRHRP